MSDFIPLRWLYDGQMIWVRFNIGYMYCRVTMAAGDAARVTNERHNVIDQLVSLENCYERRENN